MNQRIVARGLPGGVIALATCLLLVFGGLQPVAAGDFVPGVTEEPRGTETPLTETPTETAVPDNAPGGGGIVPSPTEVDRDGVAPGQVDLVIVTSDGGMVPAGTTACIGDVCQTLSTDTVSSFKWRFERMKEGWQEIRVRGAASYDGAVSSVQVAPGGLVRATVEIVRIGSRGNEGTGNNPPPEQEVPPTGGGVGSNPGSGAESGSGGNDTTNPQGTQRFAQVTDLPEAGTGTAHQSLTLFALLAAASGMFALAAIVRRRTTGGNR
jgi:hypothetical protein